MPVVTGFLGSSGLVVGSGVGHLGVGLATGGLVKGALLGLGKAVLIAGVARAISPKPQQNTALGGVLGITQRDADAPARIVYGRSRISGLIVYASGEGTSNEFLDLVIVFCVGPVAGIDAIYFNNEKAIDADGAIQGKWQSYVMVEKKLGVDGDNFPLLISNTVKWTDEHKLTGLAAIRLRLNFNADIFQGGIPNITADIRGKNTIYDPRTNTTAYSENPALCLADYVKDALSLSDYAVGGINSNALIEAANICDEDITLANGQSEKRYSCNGALVLGGSVKSNIEVLLSAMGGRFITKSGQFYIQAGAYVPPTFTISEDMIVGSIEVNTLVSRAEIFNGIKGRYVAPENEWVSTDFPAIQSEIYRQEDKGDIIWKGDFDLPFTISPSMAQRLAKIELEWIRRQMSVRLSCNLKAWNVQCGDVVSLTYARWGFEQKPFYVESRELAIKDGALVIALTLKETSQQIYNWSTSEEQIVGDAPKTNLPSFSQIVAPSVPELTEKKYITRDGSAVKVGLDVSFTGIASNIVAYYEAETKAPDSNNWISEGRVNTFFEKLDVKNGLWLVRVRVVSFLGVRSRWATSSIIVFGLSDTPKMLENISLQEQNSETALLSWDGAVDLDVRFGGKICVRHTTSEPPLWENSYLLAEVGGQANLVSVSLKKGTYLIAPKDSSGVRGNFATVNTDGLTAFNFRLLNPPINEAPTFSGDKTHLVVSSDALVLAKKSGGEAFEDEGVYLFANKFDFGKSYNVRLRSDISISLVDIQDAISKRGLISKWPSISGSTGGEPDIVVQIRTKADDDAWNSWQKLDVKGVYARHVEARAILASQDNRFSPIVFKMSIVAEYLDVAA